MAHGLYAFLHYFADSRISCFMRIVIVMGIWSTSTFDSWKETSHPRILSSTSNLETSVVYDVWIIWRKKNWGIKSGKQNCLINFSFHALQCRTIEIRARDLTATIPIRSTPHLKGVLDFELSCRQPRIVITTSHFQPENRRNRTSVLKLTTTTPIRRAVWSCASFPFILPIRK